MGSSCRLGGGGLHNNSCGSEGKALTLCALLMDSGLARPNDEPCPSKFPAEQEKFN